jgi:hypothetical protein
MHGQWEKGIASPNPRGRPRRDFSIAGILRQRLDRRAFADRLIAVATGQIEGVPYLAQVSAARLILAYTDGLPRPVAEKKGELKICVEYVTEGQPTDGPIIDVGDRPLIEDVDD